MDNGLDTEHNAEAAKMWAETYGVLGLNPPDTQSLEENPLRRITAERLAPQGHVYVPPWRHSNSGLGGPPNESVENFTLEAWDANTTLRLYEAINAPKKTGLEAIREFMSTEEEHDLPGRSYMERKVHGRDYESACRWARQVVARGIESKVKGTCFPAVENYEYVGHKDENGKDVYDKAKQGWGFESLLGAMWLQMMWLVAEPPRLCRWCRKAVGGSRKDKKYCDDKCKANWNYNIGGGKSGKKEKKRSRFGKDS